MALDRSRQAALSPVGTVAPNPEPATPVRGGDPADVLCANAEARRRIRANAARKGAADRAYRATPITPPRSARGEAGVQLRCADALRPQAAADVAAWARRGGGGSPATWDTTPIDALYEDMGRVYRARASLRRDGRTTAQVQAGLVQAEARFAGASTDRTAYGPARPFPGLRHNHRAGDECPACGMWLNAEDWATRHPTVASRLSGIATRHPADVRRNDAASDAWVADDRGRADAALADWDRADEQAARSEHKRTRRGKRGGR